MLNLLHIGWGRPLGDSLDFFRIHLDVTWGNNETQELHLRHIEFTFLRVNIQVVLQEAMEDSLNMLCVFLQEPRENQNII